MTKRFEIYDFHEMFCFYIYAKTPKKAALIYVRGRNYLNFPKATCKRVRENTEEDLSVVGLYDGARTQYYSVVQN